MKKILEYYLKACRQAIVHETELFFEFGGDYSFAFSFENAGIYYDGEFESEPDEGFYSYNSIDNISDIDKLLEKVGKFTSFTIKGYEYLGWRENLTEGRSITNKMYALVKKINTYRRDAIVKFYVDIDYGDGMCNVAGNYFFAIEIIEDLWSDAKFANYLFTVLSSITEVDTPDFYTVFFNKNSLIKDSKLVSILSTNTKARRIGYFKVLSLFFDDNKKIPANSVNKRFENYCLRYKAVLEDNRFKKGLISETKSGISAKPYIDIANELDFLNKINNIFYAGKSFKVYQVLQNEFIHSDNIFSLTEFDKLYFLEHILKNDFFYFVNLLELIFIEEKISYSQIIKKYQIQLINCLEDYKRLNSFENRKVINNLDTILSRIKKWERPDVYLEHLIMPRLNWMLDFGIIVEKEANEYLITEIGIKLFKHFSIWNDINEGKVISPDAFLDRFMIHVYDDCYNNNEVANPVDINLILEKMYKHIEDSFSLFRTLAPNRVTASQAANYSKYKLYFDDKIKVGYQFILGRLSEKEQSKFIFKYQEQYQDGYIQIKN